MSQLELVPSSAMGKRLQQYCMQAEQLYHTVQHQQEANELHLDKEILEWKKEKELYVYIYMCWLIYICSFVTICLLYM